jgi:hypothetical protein
MSQDDGGEEQMRMHTKVRFARQERVNGQLQMAAVTHVLPWAPDLDRHRWEGLQAIERKLPHPMVMTDDEQTAGAANPAMGVNALLREPLAGLEWRQFMARN